MDNSHQVLNQTPYGNAITDNSQIQVQVEPEVDESPKDRSSLRRIRWLLLEFLLVVPLGGWRLFKRRSSFQDEGLPLLINFLALFMPLFSIYLCIIWIIASPYDNSEFTLTSCGGALELGLIITAIEPYLIFLVVLFTGFVTKSLEKNTVVACLLTFGLMYKFHAIVLTTIASKGISYQLITQNWPFLIDAVIVSLFLESKDNLKLKQTKYRKVGSTRDPSNYTFDLLIPGSSEESKIASKYSMSPLNLSFPSTFRINDHRRYTLKQLNNYLDEDRPRYIAHSIRENAKLWIAFILVRYIFSHLITTANDGTYTTDCYKIFYAIFYGFFSAYYTYYAIHIIVFDSADYKYLNGRLEELRDMIDVKDYDDDRLKLDMFCPNTLLAWNEARHRTLYKTRKLSAAIDILGVCLIIFIWSYFVLVLSGEYKSPLSVIRAGTTNWYSLIGKWIELFSLAFFGLGGVFRIWKTSRMNIWYDRLKGEVEYIQALVKNLEVEDFRTNKKKVKPAVAALTNRFVQMSNYRDYYLTKLTKTLDFIVKDIEADKNSRPFKIMERFSVGPAEFSVFGVITTLFAVYSQVLNS